MKIGILGIGNPLLGDDGFGVEVVRKLKEEIGESPDLEIIDGGSLGIYLLPYLEDKTYLIVVDVVNFGGKPGEIVKFELNKIPGFIGLKVSEHQITFHFSFFSHGFSTGSQPNGLVFNPVIIDDSIPFSLNTSR